MEIQNAQIGKVVADTPKSAVAQANDKRDIKDRNFPQPSSAGERTNEKDLESSCLLYTSPSPRDS